MSTRHSFLMDFFSGCQNPGSVRASSILLLYSNALRQISRLVYVQTFCNRYIVAQQLQRDHSQTADKMLVHLRHIDCEVHLIFRLILSVSSQAHQVCILVNRLDGDAVYFPNAFIFNQLSFVFLYNLCSMISDCFSYLAMDALRMAEALLLDVTVRTDGTIGRIRLSTDFFVLNEMCPEKARQIFVEGCGADCHNVAFINEETHNGLTLDDERIRQVIIDFRPRLVVIDPIQAYLGNDSDLQIAGRARKLMQRLGMWASVYDCAVVLIGHLNKKEGSKDLYRSLGTVVSIAQMFLRQIRCITHPTSKRYAEDYISSRQKLLWLTEPLKIQINFTICQTAETSIFGHAANKEITCNNLEHLGTANSRCIKMLCG